MTTKEIFNKHSFNYCGKNVLFEDSAIEAMEEYKNESQEDGVSQCIIKQSGGKECKELCELCFERYKSFLFEQEQGLDVNGLLRSMHAIVEREGKDTNWEAFRKKLEHILKVQHKQMYPSMYDENGNNIYLKK